MRQNPLAYYAAIYPVLIGVMIQAILCKASPIERGSALAFALVFAGAGALLWTRLERRLLRAEPQG
jgi:hypothetical protein